MLNNRLFSAATLVTLLGLAACGGETEETVPLEEQTPITADTEPVAPEVTQGTVTMDTTGAGAIVDTGTVVRTDTGGVR